MQVVTAQEMQVIDRKAIDELRIPSLVLMENAGTAVVNQLQNELGDLTTKQVVILVGKGNNGGDGLVVARHLLNRNVKVQVYLLGSKQQLSEECRHNLNIYTKLKGEVHTLSEQILPRLKVNLALADIIVDALLGTGFSGQAGGLLPKIFELVNKSRKFVVAIDIPSGVNGTSGYVGKSAVKASMTVTLGFLKTGLLLYPGADYCGTIKAVDIGIPKIFAEGIHCYLADATIKELLPSRPAWSHKGTYGHCLVIAGSRTMAGAAYLTSYSLLRCGAGLVTLAVPESIHHQFQPGEIMVTPVPETETGTISLTAVEQLLELSQDKTALVIGPGLGNHPELQTLVQAVLQSWQGPMVIDADGLNNIRDLDWLLEIPQAVRKQWVFTPHPGEMSRLLGVDKNEVVENRINIARSAFRKLGINIVLKGVPTITVGNKRMYINSTGNPGMSTAGMGDVLSGVIGALLCQGMSACLAAAAGVYFHGKAGDYLKEEKGVRGIIASDMLSVLPKILS